MANKKPNATYDTTATAKTSFLVNNIPHATHDPKSLPRQVVRVNERLHTTYDSRQVVSGQRKIPSNS